VLFRSHTDTDGFSLDFIEVLLFSKVGNPSGPQKKTYIANYQGSFPMYCAPSVFFEVLGAKDENEVIPKLLLALPDDKRFANFGEYWLPSDLLISDKINDVRKIIEKSEQPLSTHDILEQVYANGNKEELNERLEFSLNYFLEQDRRFVRITGEPNKWDLRSRPPKVQPPMTDHCTVTIKPEWIEKDILIVPRKLSEYLGKTNTIHIFYDQFDELLSYNANNRLITGLGNFYSTKAIAEWDIVRLWLQSLEPAKLFISSRWQKRLDRLLKIEPTDLKWERISLRDCIIVVLSKFKTPAHYHDIYSEIALHKQVSLGSIIGTLSRYNHYLFVHTSLGQWQLVGWTYSDIIDKQGQKPNPEVIALDKEIWKAVAIIEDNDYVYKLLQKAAGPLSFDEICSRLADYLKVDVNQLRATGFLKPDKRFRRLDNGTWALEEGFVNSENERQESEQEKSQNVSVKTQKGPWIDNLWLVVKNLVVSVRRFYSYFRLIFRK
jgi:DNA-directed RNA polymerase delta subunit